MVSITSGVQSPSFVQHTRTLQDHPTPQTIYNKDLIFLTSISPTSIVTMKYLAAYLLLTIGGNAAPSAKDITALLATVGIEAESQRIETLIAQLAGKDINEVLSHFSGNPQS